MLLPYGYKDFTKIFSIVWVAVLKNDFAGPIAQDLILIAIYLYLFVKNYIAINF